MSVNGQWILSALVVFMLAYFCGSFPSGYLIGRFNGIDIRQHGSHNIGATNVRRILGRDWSLVCFFLDFFKGYLPVLLFGQHMAAGWPVGAGWGALFAALGAVCGHMFPVWLKFQGGKGVATGLGVVAAVAFLPALVGGLIWVVVFHFSRMVSLASMISVGMIGIVSMIFRLTGLGFYSWPGILVLYIIAIMVVYKHRENIQRIMNGTESRFLKKKKKDTVSQE